MATNENEVVPERDWEGEAKKMGWSPKETFRGDPAKWVAAQEYVERGEAFIPILQHTNRGLKEEVAALRERNMQQERMLAANTEALKQLQETVNKTTVDAAKDTKEDIITAIEAAREKGDVRAEIQLRERLDATNEAIRRANESSTTVAATTTTVPEKPDLTKHPDYIAFETANPWFREDPIMAAAAVAIMGQINATGEMRSNTPAERFAEVAKRTLQRFNQTQPARESTSRVESGRQDGTNPGGGGRRSGGGKSFSDLPAEAKASCDVFAASMVGKRNANGEIKYPDRASWEKYYVSQYFGKKDDL